MIKTQIQMPDDLYREVKRLAAAREWSLAETVRRGIELLLEVHPASPVDRAAVWTPPRSSKVGWRGLSAAALKDAAIRDQEPTKPRL